MRPTSARRPERPACSDCQSQVPTPRGSATTRSPRRPTMNDQTAAGRRAELDEAVDRAKTDEDRVHHQRQHATTRARQLREQLAARPADEYDDTGTPAPKTEAARLAEE